MESVSVERLDHLGVVASVIKDVGIGEMIDARLGRHDQEEISTGEAGLDHRAGHPMPFESTPWLAEAD
jgi:hypothetical protein